MEALCNNLMLSNQLEIDGSGFFVWKEPLEERWDKKVFVMLYDLI